MMGPPGENRGIIPRLSEALFDRAAKTETKGMTYKVELSYLEIYSEKIRDLLAPNSSQNPRKNLKIREDPETGPYVYGLLACAVSSYDEMEKLIEIGAKTRTVSATKMNAQSSRSHAVLSIIFTATREDDVTNLSTSQTSKIQLVDLAGSERVSKSGVKGVGLKEAAMINKSLTTLGMVISSLAKKASKSQEFVPYRDSVLTYLLKESLGGNAKTIMIAALSPADINFDETLSTLRYADRMKKIMNVAKINEDPNAAMIRTLREEIDKLKSRLKSSGADVGDIKALQDKLIQNKLDRERERKEWEQKLQAARKAAQLGEEALNSQGISVKIDRTKPHLLNLNEDPQMSETLVYYVKPDAKATLISSRFHRDKPCIKIQGEGMSIEHCYLLQEEDKSIILSQTKLNGKTFVNGKLIKDNVKLTHGDRIAFGRDQLFRFFHPEGKGMKSIGWSDAHAELLESKDWKEYIQELETQRKELEALKKREGERKKALERRKVRKLEKIRKITSIKTEEKMKIIQGRFDNFMSGVYGEIVLLVDEMNALICSLGILGDTEFRLEIISDAAHIPTETTRTAQVAVDYKSKINGFSCKGGEKVDIIMICGDGFSLVATDESNIGWIPSSFLYPEAPADENSAPLAVKSMGIRCWESTQPEIHAVRKSSSVFVEDFQRSIVRCKWRVPLFLQRLATLRKIYNRAKTKNQQKIVYNPTEILLKKDFQVVGISSLSMHMLLFSGGSAMETCLPVLDPCGNTIAKIVLELVMEETKSDELDDGDEPLDLETPVTIGCTSTGVAYTIRVIIKEISDIDALALPLPVAAGGPKEGVKVELITRHSFWNYHPKLSCSQASLIEWDKNPSDTEVRGPVLQKIPEMSAKAQVEKGDQEITEKEEKGGQEVEKGRQEVEKTTDNGLTESELAAIRELNSRKEKLKAERNSLLEKRKKIRELRMVNLKSRQDLANDIGKQRKVFSDFKGLLKKLQSKVVEIPEDDANTTAEEKKIRKQKRLLQKRCKSKIDEINSKVQIVNTQYNQLRKKYQQAQTQNEDLGKQDSALKKKQVDMQQRHKKELNKILSRIKEINQAAAKRKAETEEKARLAVENAHLRIIEFEPTMLGMIFGDSRVLEVKADSQADKLGVKKGWILKKFNDITISKGVRMREMFLNNRKEGKRMSLTFDTRGAEEDNMHIDDATTWTYRLKPQDKCGYRAIGLRNSADINDVARDEKGEVIEIGEGRGEIVVIERLHDILTGQLFLRLEDGRGWIFALDPRDCKTKILDLIYTSKCTENKRRPSQLIGQRKVLTEVDKKLLEAFSNKNFGDVEGLLKEKADPNCQDSEMDTPLHQSARWNKTNIVQLLIQHKALPNKKSERGNTALIEACWRGCLDTAKVLITAKANVNDITEAGNTAIHWSAYKGHVKVVELLLKNKAKPDMINTKGRTPLHYALRQHNNEIVTLLQPAIASSAKTEEKNNSGMLWGRCSINKEFRHIIRRSQMTPELLAHLCDSALTIETLIKVSLTREEFSTDLLDDLSEEQIIDKLGDMRKNPPMPKPMDNKCFAALTARLSKKRQIADVLSRDQVFSRLQMQENEMRNKSKDDFFNAQGDEELLKEISQPTAATPVSCRTPRNGKTALSHYLENTYGAVPDGIMDLKPSWSKLKLFVAADIEEISEDGKFKPVRMKEEDPSRTKLDDPMAASIAAPSRVYRLSTRCKRFVVTIVQPDKNVVVLESIKQMKIKYFYLTSRPLEPFALETDQAVLSIERQELLQRGRILHCEARWTSGLMNHELFNKPSEAGERVVVVLEVEVFVRDSTKPMAIKYPISVKIYKKPQVVERKNLTHRLHKLGNHFRIERKLNETEIKPALRKCTSRLKNLEMTVIDEHKRQHKCFVGSIQDTKLKDDADMVFTLPPLRDSSEASEQEEDKKKDGIQAKRTSSNFSKGVDKIFIAVVPEQHEEVVFKEGFLFKKENFGKFKRFFFELKPPHLYYRKTKGVGKPAGHFDLISAKIERITNNAKHPYAFQLKSKSSNWTISANNKEEAEQWIEALDVNN